MQNKQTSYQVVIAHDHEVTHDAVSDLLVRASATGAQQYEVPAFAQNGLEAIAAVNKHQPALPVPDISMPLASASRIQHDTRRWSPATRIVMFTGTGTAGTLVSTVESGFDGLSDPI